MNCATFLDEQIRQESTSGGAFTAIASWVLSQGGIVFGGGFKGDTFQVVHQAVENVEDLNRFRNSKNAFVRLTCHRLGIYSLAKRAFMMVYTRKDERASHRGH